MTNKEIKIGDKIWLYSACLDKNSYYVVSSVKREKTLVTVVVDAKNVLYYKDYQITMYGHASSSLLSGFERIRKALIKLVKKAGEGYENVIDGVSIENAIAWLEKHSSSLTKE